MTQLRDKIAVALCDAYTDEGYTDCIPQEYLDQADIMLEVLEDPHNIEEILEYVSDGTDILSGYLEEWRQWNAYKEAYEHKWSVVPYGDGPAIYVVRKP